MPKELEQGTFPDPDPLGNLSPLMELRNYLNKELNTVNLFGFLRVPIRGLNQESKQNMVQVM